LIYVISLPDKKAQADKKLKLSLDGDGAGIETWAKFVFITGFGTII
jgi:hypothetical protein